MTDDRDRSVVLLSGGLDSTVNLYEAFRVSEIVLTLTVDYGQKAAMREIMAAKRICEPLSIPHKVLTLSWFRDFTDSALISPSSMIPCGSVVKIEDFATSEKTANSVWVPNRNGILLNIAAGFAEGLDAQWVVPGFNSEEAQTFSDNTADFAETVSRSLSYSTKNQVKVKCFTLTMDKSEIARRGRQLEVPFDFIWPCYFGGEKPCGQCESCQRFQRALKGVSL